MVCIKNFIGAAALFSVVFAAPSSVKRTNHKEESSPSSYEDSSKSYQGSYQDSKYENSYKDNKYENSYEDNKYEDNKYENNKYEDNSYDHEYTTTPEKSYETKTAEHEQYTEVKEYEYTKEYEVTKTLATEESYPTYGSGSASWGEGYDDCVSKCLATYGNKDTWYKPTATQESEGSTGTGATHTVVVAPSQGVLRFIPFAVNASIGDTVKFMWGANTHTVTKGSDLLPCNKTADTFFTSGVHDKDFVFTQVVNSTDPTYYFCNTPGHCQKGMFGIINPSSAQDAPTSASLLMSDLKANNADLKTYATVVDKNTVNNEFARNWGGNINIGALPGWAQSLAAENILYTRSVLAANPDVVKDGQIDLSALSTNPMMVPDDVSVALQNAASGPATPAPVVTGAANAPSPSPSDAASAEAAASPQNSASSLASPRVLVALTVVVATFFAL